MKVLIAGDSHVVPLMKGQKWRATKGADDPRFSYEFSVLGTGRDLSKPFFDDRGDHVLVRAPRFAGVAARIPPEGAPPDWIGVSAPFHATRILARGFAPAAQAGAGEHAVSAAVIRQGIADDVEHGLALLDVLRRAHRVFVIESPWPFAHSWLVRNCGQARVAALHAAYRGFVMDALGARGLPVVEVDPEWIEQGTYTSARFRSDAEKDPHHGNNIFGASMMERVEALLGSLAG